MGSINPALSNNFKRLFVHSVKPVSVKQLRHFGWLVGGLFALIFGLLLPHLHNGTRPIWPWFLAAVLIGMGTIAPAYLQQPYRLWMRFGLVLGAINTRIILVLMYYLSIVPTGLLLRFFGKDLLDVKIDKSLPSYRCPHDDKSPVTESMLNPF